MEKIIISAHNDGSYIIWSADDEGVEPIEPPNTHYGPYPCKSWIWLCRGKVYRGYWGGLDGLNPLVFSRPDNARTVDIGSSN